MQTATIVIPNLNGMKFLKDCLDSLMEQSRQDFSIILIDNGSGDGSAEYVESHYPEVQVSIRNLFGSFCRAVNQGILLSQTPYVILLNNDTVCDPFYVEKLIGPLRKGRTLFACAPMMVQMSNPERMDNGGDYYCALGWAYAYGKGKEAQKLRKGAENIFRLRRSLYLPQKGL